MQPIQRHHAADLDELLAVLADESCRRTITALRDAASPVTSLDALAARDRGHHGDAGVTTATRLHHVTLPRLDEAGLLDYDPVSGRVRYHHHESVTSLLEAVEGGGR
jgi:hypothetical protein